MQCSTEFVCVYIACVCVMWFYIFLVYFEYMRVYVGVCILICYLCLLSVSEFACILLVLSLCVSEFVCFVYKCKCV